MALALRSAHDGEARPVDDNLLIADRAQSLPNMAAAAQKMDRMHDLERHLSNSLNRPLGTRRSFRRIWLMKS